MHREQSAEHHARRHRRPDRAQQVHVHGALGAVLARRDDGGRHDSGERGADRELHLDRLGDAEQRKDIEQHRHDDDAAAHPEQPREGAGDGARRRHRERQASEPEVVLHRCSMTVVRPRPRSRGEWLRLCHTAPPPRPPPAGAVAPPSKLAGSLLCLIVKIASAALSGLDASADAAGAPWRSPTPSQATTVCRASALARSGSMLPSAASAPEATSRDDVAACSAAITAMVTVRFSNVVSTTNSRAGVPQSRAGAASAGS